MSNILVVAVISVLEKMDNDILAAANNSLTGFGRIDYRNRAYQAMKESTLIREDGYAYDGESLLDALNYEINRRVKAGTFV